MFSLSFGDSDMANSMEKQFASKQTQPSSGVVTTPGGGEDDDDVGPVMRLNDVMTHIGTKGMERMALSNFELSKSVNRQADEVFRQDFPILRPEVDEPAESEKARVEEWFRNINDAGQTFHGLLKTALMDHARLGTGMLIARKRYTVMEGEVIDVSLQQIVKGDPKMIRPITDESNNIGGLYSCPQHREQVTQDAGACEECGADLREVTYAKTQGTNSNSMETVFFDDEVVSFSFYNTRLHGRDGLSPVAGVWKQAYILDQMLNYHGKYFSDDTGNRYPDKMLFVTTSNADAFEKRAEQAKDNRQESPMEQGILFLENAELEIEVVDMMSEGVLGQAPETKQTYKSDIRTAFGLADVVDSDEDSASLASGSKGVDVMSRSIQSLRTDLEREVLTEIEDLLGMDDWKLTFEEEVEDEEKVGIDEKAEAIQRLSEAGQSYRIENGNITLTDTDEERQDESETTESNSDDDGGPDVSV